MTIYTKNLDNGLEFNKVSISVDIKVVDPIKVNHPLSPSSKEKNLTIISLFTPQKPYRIYID